MALHLYKLESPLPMDAIIKQHLSNITEIGPKVLEKKMIISQVYRHMDGLTDNEQQGDQKSCQLR